MSTLAVSDAQRSPELAGVDSTLLQLAIDDVEAEIVDRFGAYGVQAMTERIVLPTYSSTIVLRRRPASITSVKEWDSDVELPATTLAATDYRVSGYTIERLRSGSNPGWSWSPYGVEVVYLPVDDTARRKMATLDVLKLEFGFSGVGSIRIGDYSRSVAGQQSASSAVVTDRRKILSRLRPKAFVLR